jgi:Ca2+-binding RTX toxin-like protein
VAITSFTQAQINSPPGSVQLTGGPGSDHFTVLYSNTEITVAWSANGGPVTHLGPYTIGSALAVDGLGGVDSLTLALTPQQIADLATADIGTLKTYLASPSGQTLTLTVPPSSLLTATNFESADFAAHDDMVVTSIVSCFANITHESQIQAGGGGPDTLTGTSAADLIFGGDGDDLISGLDGADCLFGGAGNDSIFGGNMSDLLVGGSGDDSLVDDLGFDRLIGGPGADRHWKAVSMTTNLTVVRDKTPCWAAPAMTSSKYDWMRRRPTS